MRRFFSMKTRAALACLFWILLMLLSAEFSFGQQAAVHVFLIGDSTMSDKEGTPEENPERGWGQLLPSYFSSDVVVHNHAVNGRSTKSFLAEGRWDKVLSQLQSGDYVFIQFGHNDQKEKDPNRYTNPWTGYRRNLEKFVEETLAKGAYPIVLSSIVRRKFNEHGTLVDTHGAYPFVARQVAERLEVPFIDLQLITEDYIMQLGPEKSKDVYLWLSPNAYERFPKGKQDDTHLSLYGARTYAGMVAKELRRQAVPLAQLLKS